MNPDRQDVLVDVPQLLEDEFSEEPRVAEHQRRPVGLDLLIKLRDRPGRGMAAPRYPRLIRQQDRKLRIGALLPFDNGDLACVTDRRQPASKIAWIGQSGGKPDPLQRRGNGLQPSQGEREKVPPLGRRKGVYLVDHHPLQTGKQGFRLWIGQQQRKRLRRGQQNVRRIGPLPRLAIGRRIAAAHLDPQRQAKLCNRSQQIALNVMGQRLERGNIQRVQALGRRLSGQT